MRYRDEIKEGVKAEILNQEEASRYVGLLDVLGAPQAWVFLWALPLVVSSAQNVPSFQVSAQKSLAQDSPGRSLKSPACYSPLPCSLFLHDPMILLPMLCCISVWLGVYDLSPYGNINSTRAGTLPRFLQHLRMANSRTLTKIQGMDEWELILK